jgi:hypothetical protein
VVWLLGVQIAVAAWQVDCVVYAERLQLPIVQVQTPLVFWHVVWLPIPEMLQEAAVHVPNAAWQVDFVVYAAMLHLLVELVHVPCVDVQVD